MLGEGVVRQGTLQQVKPPAGSADVVATLDVLEHVPLADHAAFARVMAEVLAPGGIWAIKVPSTEGLYYRLSAMLAAGGAAARRHFHAAAVADRLRIPAYGVLRPAVAAALAAPSRLHAWSISGTCLKCRSARSSTA